MIDSHDYKVQLAATGVRSGIVESSDDGLSALYVASPPEFGGPAGVWSPEHLYTVSVAACLMTTFRSIAEIARLEILEYSDEATGHLQRGDDRLYAIDTIMLRPTVVVADDDDVEKAQRLLRKAEEVCLISRSIETEVLVEGRVLVAQHAGS